MKWENYKNNMKGALDSFEFDETILGVLRHARKFGKSVYIAGNGGSAAVATHFACDLNKCSYKDWKSEKNRFRAFSLNSDTSYITAIANDESYADIFVEQLKNYSKPGDVLVLISSSGNSPNVVKAAKWAVNNGLETICLTGFKGGKLKEICKHTGYVAIEDYGLSEDIHCIFTHYISTVFRGE